MNHRKRLHRFLVVLTLSAVQLAFAVPHTRLAAQDSTRAVLGEKVRIAAPQLEQNLMVGTLWAMRPDAVVLRRPNAADEPVVIPKTSINRVEVLRPTRETHARTGAIAGAAIGLLALGYYAYETERRAAVGNDGIGIPIHPAFILGPAGGGLGLVGGVLIGKRLRVDRWKALPLPLQMVDSVRTR